MCRRQTKLPTTPALAELPDTGKAEDDAAIRAKQRELRMDLYNRLSDFVSRVKFREDNLTQNLKFRKAALDKANATYSIAVGGGDSREHLDGTAERRESSDATMWKGSPSSSKLRKRTVPIWKRSCTISPPGTMRPQRLWPITSKNSRRFRKPSFTRKANAGKSILELPILDAFNSPLKIDQIWLPQSDAEQQFPRRGPLRSLHHLSSGDR